MPFSCEEREGGEVTNEEIAVKLAEHSKEIGSLKHRTKELEDKSDVIQELVLSVKELAVNMHSMKEDVKILKERPAKRWDTIITAIITAIIGGIAGVVFANIF